MDEGKYISARSLKHTSMVMVKTEPGHVQNDFFFVKGI